MSVPRGCRTMKGGAGPYVYGINGSGGSCYTIGTSTRCFGGSGGSIRGTADPSKGGGDGLYVDFIASMTNAVNMKGKDGTGGGGGGGLNSALTESLSQSEVSIIGTLYSKLFTPVYSQSRTSLNTPGVTPGSGGTGTFIMSYLSAEECPADLPYYNYSLLSPVCTTCLATDPSMPLFDSSMGMCIPCDPILTGDITLLTSEITGDSTRQNISALNTPTGLSASTAPNYTLAVQFYNTGDGGGWREFFSNQGGDTWDDANNRPFPGQRNPLLSVYPTYTGAEKNKVLIAHNLSNGNDIGVGTATPLDLNRWYTLAFTGTATKLTIYVDGVKNNEVSAPPGTTFVMSNTNTFKWVPITYNGFTAIKLKNGYWWSRVLSDTEISQIPTYYNRTALQISEVDLGTSSFAPTTKPTVTPGMNPVYSISMWLKTPPMPANSSGLWWTVFGFGGYWNTLVPFTGGKWRLILQTAANSTGPDPNYSNWADIGVLDPSKYYHIGFVLSGTLPPQVYVNGQFPSPRATWLYGGGSQQGMYSDGSDAKFNWGNQPMTGTKVRDLYYFDRALSDQEMALLGATPYYDPSTKTCVATCPAPLTPNPKFHNVCAIPPLLCQGARPYFNGYECAGSQVNFSKQGGAIGGNSIVNNGAYIVHTFTSDGVFSPPIDKSLVGDVLIVGGGGGGGTYSIESITQPRSAGGGGGGDVRYLSGVQFGQQSWVVTVGQGGAPNQNGGATSFGTYVATGGGAGSAYPDIVNAQNGASGGGGSGRGYIGYPGSGTGFSGGAGEYIAGTGSAGGGGGGKNADGTKGNLTKGGNGGDGVPYSITGAEKYYGGGGGGSAVTINQTYVAAGLGGDGGKGGGGYGAGSVVYNYLNYQKTNMTRGENGTPGTGGGGGGGAAVASPGPANYRGNPVTNPGSRGGSGIVIIRYSTVGLCPSDLPYFNPGLKTCTVCADATPVYDTATAQCTRCPAIKPYWNGIACVAACPPELPFADTNNVCQLPCSPASPNWDGTQCTKVCPEDKPVASNGQCVTCQVATPSTPYWNPTTKTCVAGCPESIQGSVCKACYEIVQTPLKPFWNASLSRCEPCPDSAPAWTGPATACQACPPENPIFHNGICQTCFAINSLRPLYNMATADLSMMSVMRCQPCPVASLPKWDDTLKMCTVCPDSTPYWNLTTSPPSCTICPPSKPYWNSRTCSLPSNIADAATTTAATMGTPSNINDKNPATSWQATGYNGGNYTANKRSTRDTTGTLWNGEFVQIETSNSYILSSYLLNTPDLRGWAVLGSNDGFAWEKIDSKNSITNFNQTFYITPPISNAYPLFRLVVTNVLGATATINEWTLQTANAAVTPDTANAVSAFTVLTGAIQGCTTLSCVIEKSSKTDITDLIYGNYPPKQIGTDLLPDKAQEALSNCSSNVDCGFVQFDFLSNVSKFSTTSVPYTVSTMSTTGSDIGVFQKKYGTTPPPRLRSPPGFKYDYYYIKGTRLGSNLTSTVDVCGQACAKDPSCKGFNFYYTDSKCEFYSTVNPTDYEYNPDKGSFVRDPYILKGAQNENRTPYTNLNDSGSTCQNMTACNTDILSLVGQLGSTVQSFSTAELDSCNACPIRGVAQQGSVYTITNEANIVSNVTTTSAVQSSLRFSNTVTTTHINIVNGNFRIRPYVQPQTTATVNIRGNSGSAQIWMGAEPFAAGTAPKNCFDVYDPRPPGMSFSYFRPLYQLGTTITNQRTGEVCLTTAKGTYTYQTCTGSCGTGTDLDPGTRDASTQIANYSGGNPDLLWWEFIPVDWVTNGYYIRSKGSNKRTTGIGPAYVKTDSTTLDTTANPVCPGWKPANVKAQPYLKWGSYIGSYTNIGSSSSTQTSNFFAGFAEGFVTGATLGFASVDLVDRNNPNNIFFNSFPPQFNTESYPFNCLYRDLQTLPSQGPGGDKFDDKEYIFVIEPA